MSSEEKKKLLDKIEEEVLNEEGLDPENEIDPEKEEENLRRAAALWEAVQNGETKHVTQKVAAILNRYDETRNSDVALMIKYWQIYQNHNGDAVSHQDLFKLERLTTIARARAKIQNEYKLFLPTVEKIRRYRKELAEYETEFQIATKPELPIIHIYADETGKTDDYLIVGGFWVLDDRRNGQIKNQLLEWVSENKEGIYPNFPSEFHFKRLSNDGSNLQVYKDFFSKVVGIGDVISFKAIGVNKTKLGRIKIQDLLDELYYQLIRQGIDHEVKTGRIDFPKQISYVKDLEGDESRFHIEQLSQKIKDNLKVDYEDRLRLNAYIPLDSKMERFLQIADLFTASINRIINYQPKNNNRNAKDELAEYILNLINLQTIKLDVQNYKDVIETEGDMSVLYLFD